MDKQKSDKPIIRQCVCSHEFQDKRLMNPTMKEEGTKQLFRCTVCGRTHTKN